MMVPAAPAAVRMACGVLAPACGGDACCEGRVHGTGQGQEQCQDLHGMHVNSLVLCRLPVLERRGLTGRCWLPMQASWNLLSSGEHDCRKGTGGRRTLAVSNR